jgi:hypothetical protein
MPWQKTAERQERVMQERFDQPLLWHFARLEEKAAMP